ncbi:hypothetical protein ACZ92_21790 [Vibrio parahaemolyticus]|nr:hypothetical protein ACZ92_21790 [Vibrio parahaemolyticus]
MMSVLVWALFVLFWFVFLVLFGLGGFFVEIGIFKGLVRGCLNFINSKQSIEGKKSTIELSEDKGEQ